MGCKQPWLVVSRVLFNLGSTHHPRKLPANINETHTHTQPVSRTKTNLQISSHRHTCRYSSQKFTLVEGIKKGERMATTGEQYGSQNRPEVCVCVRVCPSLES